MSNQIQLPPYGLTLLPPWWCAILWAGKRVENRHATDLEIIQKAFGQ